MYQPRTRLKKRAVAANGTRHERIARNTHPTLAMDRDDRAVTGAGFA
jgi:hypothetical protein